MTKVDKVQEKIIETSLYLFNTNGITYTSIQDIITATELSKGAIYRRFKNKEEIVLAPTTKVVRFCGAFSYSNGKEKTAIDKILAIFLIYQDATNNPPIAGGCPLLNSAIESTGVFPHYKSSKKRL